MMSNDRENKNSASHVFMYVCTSSINANPVEITGEFLGNVGLATSWQTNHDDNTWRYGDVGYLRTKRYTHTHTLTKRQ